MRGRSARHRGTVSGAAAVRPVTSRPARAAREAKRPGFCSQAGGSRTVACGAAGWGRQAQTCSSATAASAAEFFPPLLQRRGAILHARLPVLLFRLPYTIRSRRQSLIHEKIRPAPRPGRARVSLAQQTCQPQKIRVRLWRLGTTRQAGPPLRYKFGPQRSRRCAESASCVQPLQYRPPRTRLLPPSCPPQSTAKIETAPTLR